MSNKSSFLFGLSLGLALTIVLHLTNLENYKSLKFTPWNINSSEKEVSLKGSECQGSADNQTRTELKILKGDDSIAKNLYNRVRVACWILTSPSNLDRKAIHVKNTWGRKCQLVLFMSSVKNETFPTVGLNTTEGRNHLTAKSMQAFQYLYDHHLNDSDWFLKADDDTYVIMENLRYFLSDEDSNEPVYFGQIFKFNPDLRYASGGAGYVLSREALRRFGERGDNFTKTCRPDSGHEDVEMGKCLRSLGVKVKSTFDVLNRHRFHWGSPESYLRGNFPDVFKNGVDADGGRAGIENMSNYAISFHYVSGNRMYDLEYYIYHLRPYGILNLPLELNNKTIDD
ncbi:Glycoprotein-N-acetylgalactosamine 3-beta-galactosyltransferase 1 [Bulinus truncatus]|nr:Glycoprotein-N-acetylgalactosamine 3-beta-galactosyltransferase 1 [Bulinus truncatus]